MEYYEPEPLIEQYSENSEPFPFNINNDPSYFQIKIEGNCARVRTLVNRSLKNFGSGKKIVFIAQGRDITKAVSCVEIMKTYYKKPMYQITRISQIRTIETWFPTLDTLNLDPIRVTRSAPAIYILISQEKINDNQVGYQVYNHRDPKKVLNLQYPEADSANDEIGQDTLDNINSEPEHDKKENPPFWENHLTDGGYCTTTNFNIIE